MKQLTLKARAANSTSGVECLNCYDFQPERILAPSKNVVGARQNPSTGSIALADVVLKGEDQAPDKTPHSIASKDKSLRSHRKTIS